MEQMPYKLLVADDEYWSRERLRTIIDWNHYGIEFLEPAQDGEEVLNRMESEHPDILISDINMPIVNGVDLLEKLAEVHTDVIMFVISGYDDFNYVKSTMKAGAINYLLKPISKVELVTAISEALEMLHRRKKDSEQKAAERARLLRASSLMMDRELSLLLDKQDLHEVPSLSMNVNLGVSGYSFVLIKFHDLACAMVQYQQNINALSYTVKAKMEELFGKEGTLLFNHFSRSNEFVLLTDQNGARQTVARHYADELSELLHSPVTVVADSYTYALENISSGYLRTLAILRTRHYRPDNEVLLCGEDRKSTGGLALSDEQCNQLAAFVQSGNRQAALDIILEQSNLAGSQKAVYSCGAVERLIRQINQVLRAQLPADAHTEDVLAVENLMDAALMSVESLNLQRLCGEESNLLDAVISFRPLEESDSMHAIVRAVREDIDAHYYENLSLASLAKKHIVESSYLSRCFKQETGKNLMLYLAQKRIEKAVEQIHAGKVGLTEISFLVGYDDYTYFSRVFKKIMGISPRDYKNNWLKEQGAEI